MSSLTPPNNQLIPASQTSSQSFGTKIRKAVAVLAIVADGMLKSGASAKDVFQALIILACVESTKGDSGNSQLAIGLPIAVVLFVLLGVGTVVCCCFGYSKVSGNPNFSLPDSRPEFRTAKVHPQAPV